jgi:Family of unknown function (DUF5677)
MATPSVENMKHLKDEIDPSEPCPCESGRNYSACCKKRKLKWERDKRGNLHKVIPISDECIAALEEVKVYFKAFFGRNPRKNDPLFPMKYFTSEADMKRETLHILRQTNIRPELIYAYLQTGRVVVDPQKLSTRESAEYHNAIQEFREQVNAGTPIEDLIDPETPAKFLHLALRDVQIIGGYYIEQYINSGFSKRHARRLNAEFVVSFTFVSFIKCLRTILVLLDNGISYDANYLVRSLYESYLKVRFVYDDPSRAEPFMDQINVMANIHESDPQGSTTKRVHRNPFRWETMAKQLGETALYETLYRPLCSLSHAQITESRFFISDRGFDYLEQDFEISTLLTAHELAIRTYDCVRKNSSCQEYLKKDLFTAIQKSFGSSHLVRLWMAENFDYTAPRESLQYMKSLAALEPRLKKILDHDIPHHPADPFGSTSA